MLNKSTKQRIEDCRDILVGQLPLPSDQINMITLLLIYKFMNDIDEEYAVLNKPEFFVGDLAKFTWRKILDNTVEASEANINIADRRKKLFYEGIQAIKTSTHLPALFKDIFNEGNIPAIADNTVFGRLVDKINHFKYDHSEELGNAFEYLLMTMGTQANNGQFRTPRHIIDFVVEAVNPDKDDTFLDPACGTAGFLISAFKFLQWKYTPEAKKEVLMDIAGEVQTEITVERKVKKEVIKEKKWVTYKIYSSNEKIYIETPKKEQEDYELDPALAYQIVKAEITYKKETLRLLQGTLTHTGKYWQIQIQQYQCKRPHQEPIAQKMPKNLDLRAIEYENIFNLRQDKRQEAIQNAFQGYDNTPMMVRLAKVNMYLHQFKNPQIHQYDTLTNDSKWKENFSCILANPPFMTPKEGIRTQNRFTFSKSKKAEILFSDYIASHLKLEGKAGFIVPEGIIFTNNTDYVALRKHLLQQAGLWCVISLPAGVFQPYSGVKTSILLIDKALAKHTDNILLLKIDNDGYSLNTNRNPLDTSDLPEALAFLKQYKAPSPEGESSRLSFGEAIVPPSGVRGLLLHKSEFAKLDAYKAANTALDALRKAYRELTNYAGKLPENPTEKQRAKLHELKTDFLQQTTLPALPETEAELKTLFDTHLKVQAITYGALEALDLPALLRNAIDEAREFNLSYDKYANQVQMNISEKYKWVHLGYLTTFVQQGILRRSEELNNLKDTIPYVKMECLKSDGVLHKDRVAFTSATQAEIEQYKLLKNDFLFNVRNSHELVGKCAIYKDEFEVALFNHMLLRFRFDNSLILPDFINLVFQSDYFENRLNQIKKGSTSIWAIYQNDLEAIEIPLPPLDVQARIVEEIAQYQRVIAGCRQVIDNYTVQITPEELAGAEMVRLGEVCTLFNGRAYKDDELLNDTNLTPVLRVGNFFTSNKWYYSDLELDENKYCDKGDLLYAWSASFGPKIWEGNKVIYHYHIWKVAPNEKILKKYLYYALWIDTLSIKTNTHGNTMLHITKQNMEKREIPLPTLSMQESIVARLESEREAVEGCRRLISQYEARIAQTIGRIFEG